MKIESLKIQNFKSLKDVEINNLSNMSVFIGLNASGKSNLFDVFSFLQDALIHNVNFALDKRGGYEEVITRGQVGENIILDIEYKDENLLMSYVLVIGLYENTPPTIIYEKFKEKKDSGTFFERRGISIRSTFKLTPYLNNGVLLDSSDALAIKGLGQFKEFPQIVKLRKLIEGWHLFNLHLDIARNGQNIGFNERLSSTGNNLSIVVKNMYDNHKDIFDEVLKKFSDRIANIVDVQAKKSEDGRIILKFQEESFKESFLAQYVSDGTIKIFAYLLLLHSPLPYPILAIEEPENQLSPELLYELAEEFRIYAEKGNQVFISTHSPDFLDAVKLDELFLLDKKDGYTTISKANDLIEIRELVEAGDSLGALWRQRFLIKR